MTDIRTLLNTAVEDEPPLRMHRDDVVRAGRARVVRRRAAWIGAAAAVVVLTGAIMSTVGGAAPTTSFADPPGPCQPLPEEPCAIERSRQMTALLVQAVPTGMEVLPIPRREGAPMEFVMAHGRYMAAANLRDAAGLGKVQMQLRRWSSEPEPYTCAKGMPGSPIDCTERTIDGVPVVLTTHELPRGGVQYIARSYRADGTLVEVETDNVAPHDDETYDPSTWGKPVRSVPVLGYDQLAKIATLPGLTF